MSYVTPGYSLLGIALVFAMRKVEVVEIQVEIQIQAEIITILVTGPTIVEERRQSGFRTRLEVSVQPHKTTPGKTRFWQLTDAPTGGPQWKEFHDLWTVWCQTTVGTTWWQSKDKFGGLRDKQKNSLTLLLMPQL